MVLQQAPVCSDPKKLTAHKQSRARPRCTCFVAVLQPTCSRARRAPAITRIPLCYVNREALQLHRQQPLQCRMAATPTATDQPASTPSVDSETKDTAAAKERVRRLSTLVQLRRCYQNVLYAELLLAQEPPVYQPLTADQQSGMEEEEAQSEQDALLMVAVEIIGDMMLTADDLETGLRSLPGHFGSVYAPGSEADAEQTVKARVRQVATELRARAAEEMKLLPFPSVTAAKLAVEGRNLRVTGRGTIEVAQPATDGDVSGSSKLMSTLGSAEKAAEKFVAQRLQPAVRKVRASSPKDWLGNARAAATYARDLWDRLNGGTAGEMVIRPPEGLPLPHSSKEERAARQDDLSLAIADLEKQLQEASKQREAKLRKVDISMRARMASELRKLDDEVSSLSRALAIRTLQLEMEFIYSTLEDEALDNCAGKPIGGLKLVGRVPSDDAGDELALLAAEFALLNEALTALAQLVDRGSAVVISEEELLLLAEDVPDLRTRLGIADGLVFGGSGVTLYKLQLQFKEGAKKLQEGVEFGTRGVRLLGSDVAGAVRLFLRAALGQSLKPREVQALRRTVRDLLAFVPFTVILIAPLTPVGHVLVFGFIQRYFPGLFPSQFSARRQEIMNRYEQLQRELRSAQDKVIEEAEEAELAQAAAAVARLTAPRLASGAEGASSPIGGAAARVRKLQEAVLQVEDTLLTETPEDNPPKDHAGRSKKPTSTQAT